MKLWELEANCLKLVFADSDMNFDEADFGIVTAQDGTQTLGENSVAESNGNTKQYLVRIVDSIRRAIDYYREYCGKNTSVFDAHLFVAYYNESGNEVASTSDSAVRSERLNRILVPTIEGNPIFDIKRVRVVNKNNRNIYDDNLNFRIVDNYFSGSKRTFIVLEDDFSYYENLYNEQVWDFEVEYDVQYPYMDNNTSILTELSDYDIPLPVQNMIPVFVKGEIYEEDEPQLALNAKNEYFGFLIRFSKNKKNVQKRVKTSPVFLKR